MRPLVSICIPTYNGEKYLQEALDSVKGQTYKDIEVVISDDSSQDRTLSIANRFKQEVSFPVHIYQHQPSGIGANWNHCVEKANGEYIKFLFQDDVLENNCVTVMVDYLLKHKLKIVVSKRTIIDENSNQITEGQWYKNFHDLQKPAGIPDVDFYILNKKNLKNLNSQRYLSDNIIGEPCVSLFTKKMYKSVGPFDENLHQILDYVYWLRILSKYDIGIISQKLVKFRLHDQQASSVNWVNGIDERLVITDFFFRKMFWHMDRKMAKFYLKQKYPLLKKIIALRNKILE